jgi:hypothetical protein
LFASVPDVSEAQSNVHALTLFLLGSLGKLMLRRVSVSHAVIEEILRAKFRVLVDEYAVGGLSLAGMTCDRVAMIEARMRAG